MTDVEHRACPVCGEEILTSARSCQFCGEKFAPAPSESQGDATGGVIPYKNPPALIAYYCGIFSIAACIPIPLILLPLPIAAFVFGIKGLKKAKAEPHVKGQVHAWIGIIGGAIFTILGLIMSGFGAFAIIAWMNQK